MIRRAWGNLTPFGREALIGTAVVVLLATSLLVAALTAIERARVDPYPLPPMVIAVDIRALTEEPPAVSLGRIVSMHTGEVDGDRPVLSLSRTQVNALARDVSGSPFWAAWTVSCWRGEATLVDGGRYLVGTVSPTADFSLAGINEVWTAYGFEPERALRDPRYAVEFAWVEVMPRQGVAAWYGRGCAI